MSQNTVSEEDQQPRIRKLPRSIRRSNYFRDKVNIMDVVKEEHEDEEVPKYKLEKENDDPEREIILGNKGPYGREVLGGRLHQDSERFEAFEAFKLEPEKEKNPQVGNVGLESGIDEEEVQKLCYNLRNRDALLDLERRPPAFEAWCSKSYYGRDAECNRWFADEHGIVLHYPEAIYVTRSDFGEFRAIPLAEDERIGNFTTGKVTTINLYVTQDLVAIEFRQARMKRSRAKVFHRDSLELVYAHEKLNGHLYTGLYKGKKELFVKSIKFRLSMASRINALGQKTMEYAGFFGCDCKKKHTYLPVQVYIHRRTVLGFCYWCGCGSIEDMGTREKMGYFALEQPTMIGKLELAWFDSSHIVAFEGRSFETDLLTSVSLLNATNGSLELDIKITSGDVNICYAVSPDFLVICYRNIEDMREPQSHITRMKVKKRESGQIKEFLVPQFADAVGSLKIVSNSILLAMPCDRNTKGAAGRYQHVYTMDLAEDYPKESIMSFKLPFSEVRLLGNDKLICKINGFNSDYFQIHSLLK